MRRRFDGTLRALVRAARTDVQREGGRSGRWVMFAIVGASLAAAKAAETLRTDATLSGAGVA